MITGPGVPNLDKVMMIGTPLQGSDYANWLHNHGVFGNMFRFIYRELAEELQVGSGFAASIGRIGYTAGMIAGDSYAFYPFSDRILQAFGPHDGMVPVSRTKAEGLTDHVTVHASHAGLLLSRQVFRQTLHFLQNGRFDHA